MPPKSAKGKEREIDPDLTETDDPDLTETDPDLTQSEPDLVDADDYAEDCADDCADCYADGYADDYAADDEQQAGPSRIFYCSKCGDHLNGRIGPLCLNCQGSETLESWQVQDKRLRQNESYKIAKEAGICCYCHQRQADPGYSSCTPCRLKKKEQEQSRRTKAKEKKSEEKKKSEKKKSEKKKSEEKKKSKEKSKEKGKRKK